MHFASDNWSGAHKAITNALSEHAAGYSAAYGNGDLDQMTREKFNDIFERDVAVFFVATGTAANSLALAAYNTPGAIGFCHREAHLREDECGAPEYFAHGARLRIVDGTDGKMDPNALDHHIKEVIDWGVMGGKPAFVSLTQATEAGTVHSLDEIDALVQIAKKHALPTHMDGARFANAIAALNCSPADMTWRRGIDVVSFGGTKNGCWCAEALVFMNPDDAKAMPYLQKRAGQAFSKSRFIAAQFDAYLKDNLWLKLASHANDKAAILAQEIRSSDHAKLAWPAHINEVFAIITKQKAEILRAKGAHFLDWPAPYGQSIPTSDDELIIRLVTNFDTSDEEIRAFSKLLNAS